MDPKIINWTELSDNAVANHKCQILVYKMGRVYRNLKLDGSQLAKMKKEYSWHVPTIKFIAMKQLV